MKYQLLLDKAIKASRLALCGQGLPNDWYVLALLGLLWLRGNRSEWEKKGGKDTTHSWWEHVFAPRKSPLWLSPGSCPDWRVWNLYGRKQCPYFLYSWLSAAGQEAFGMLRTCGFWMLFIKRSLARAQTHPQWLNAVIYARELIELTCRDFSCNNRVSSFIFQTWSSVTCIRNAPPCSLCLNGFVQAEL